MTARQLVHEINDAADSVSNAKAMIEAVLFVIEGMQRIEQADALLACCGHALRYMHKGGNLLEEIAAQERKKAGM